MKKKGHLEKIYIVGDKFISCSRYENIFTVSQFLEILKKRELKKSQVIVGQGINKSTLDIIQDEINKTNARQEIVLKEKVSNKVDKEMVRKNKSDNVLITTPELIRMGSETIFTASLAVDENCAEMADHVTGQHIQGCLLTEAALQLGRVVMETHIFHKESDCYNCKTKNIKGLD